MLHLATSVARPNLVSLGTCFGKFSKSGKFKLGITSLDWLAKYAKYKVGADQLSLACRARIGTPIGTLSESKLSRQGHFIRIRHGSERFTPSPHELY
jgi:hypothetical protein